MRHFRGSFYPSASCDRRLWGILRGRLFFASTAEYLILTYSTGSTSEFTGLRGFLRRSGEIMGWAS